MYVENTFYDATYQEASLPGWKQEYRQVSSGMYDGRTSAMARLDEMTMEAHIADVVATAPQFLEDKVRSRIIVPVNWGLH